MQASIQQHYFYQTPIQHTIQPQNDQNLDIIISKFLNDQLTDIQLQQLSEQQRLVMERLQQKQKVTLKRTDQCQKLFFRRAFKFAQKQFFGKRSGKARTRNMSQFYHHYFEGVAKQMSIPLNNFYHPNKKTKPGFFVAQKSFNKSYIRLILKSNTFRQTSKIYIKKFYHECVEERSKKIPKFVKYIKNNLERAKQDENAITNFINSSKCKIPWTNNELKQAQRKASYQLQQYLPPQEQYMQQIIEQQNQQSEDLDISQT